MTQLYTLTCASLRPRMTEAEMKQAQFECYIDDLTTMSIEQLEAELDRVAESRDKQEGQAAIARSEVCLVSIHRELCYRHRMQDLFDTTVELHRCIYCGNPTTTDPTNQYPPADYCDHSGENAVDTTRPVITLGTQVRRAISRALKQRAAEVENDVRPGYNPRNTLDELFDWAADEVEFRMPHEDDQLAVWKAVLAARAA